MAAPGSSNKRNTLGSSERLRYPEYSPGSEGRGEADIDQRLGGTLIAVGLGVAAAAFAGRYAFHLWKPLGQVITDTAKKFPTSSLSSYYKGGFEQKMNKREASLILGVRLQGIHSFWASTPTFDPHWACIFCLINLHPISSGPLCVEIPEHSLRNPLQQMQKRGPVPEETVDFFVTSPSANKAKIRAAHRRIMILNHPDKGGSPYLATKINEAKDMLDSITKE